MLEIVFCGKTEIETWYYCGPLRNSKPHGFGSAYDSDCSTI